MGRQTAGGREGEGEGGRERQRKGCGKGQAPAPGRRVTSALEKPLLPVRERTAGSSRALPSVPASYLWRAAAAVGNLRLAGHRVPASA